jgi:hypothetical protein
MENNNTNIQKAIKIYKAFNCSYYWLEALINEGLINKSEAGLIVVHYS